MPILENNDNNKNTFVNDVKDFIKSFTEWVLKNFFIFIFMYILRRNLKYLINKVTFKKLKPLFKYRYVYFNSDNAKDSYIISDNDVEFYISVINNLPNYERHFIKALIGFVYDDSFHDFNDDETEDLELNYDGFDVGRYLVHKKLFRKNKYHKIIKRSDDEQFLLTLDNGKIINLIPFNFLFYIPISNSIKRKKVIKSLLK